MFNLILKDRNRPRFRWVYAAISMKPTLKVTSLNRLMLTHYSYKFICLQHKTNSMLHRKNQFSLFRYNYTEKCFMKLVIFLSPSHPRIK